jgi:hypothetical protein
MQLTHHGNVTRASAGIDINLTGNSKARAVVGDTPDLVTTKIGHKNFTVDLEGHVGVGFGAFGDGEYDVGGLDEFRGVVRVGSHHGSIRRAELRKIKFT